MGSGVRYSESGEFYRALLDGSEGAWRALLVEVSPRILRLLSDGIKGTGNEADVQDLFQATAVRMWRWRSRFDPERGTLRSWVITIANSVAAEFSRRERRRRKLSHLILIRADWLLRVHEDMQSGSDASDKLHSLLGELPSQDRDLVRLYSLGYTYGEIAQILGISSGAARTRMSRVRTRLRNSVGVPIGGGGSSLPNLSFTKNHSGHEERTS